MNITILNTSVTTQPAKKPGGKPYQLIEVAFKNNSFNGAVQGKKITSYSKAFAAVAEAQPGETFDVTTEKNGEFVEWVSLAKAGAASAAVPSVQKPRDVGPTTTGTVGRSTYETPEERAKKQVYIIRQSSVSAAINTLIAGAKTAPKRADVVELARFYEGYVLGTGASGFEDVPDLDPSFNNEPQID